MVFEYAMYGNLRELMNRQGMLTETEAAGKIKEVVLALEYLHSYQHIIHW